MKVTIYNERLQNLRNAIMFPIVKDRMLRLYIREISNYREKHLLPRIRCSSVENWLALLCLIKVKLMLRDQIKMLGNRECK